MGSVLEGMGYVEQMGELGRKRGLENRLRDLTPGVLAGTPGAYESAMATDPDSAGKLMDAHGRTLKRSGNMAKMMLDAVERGNPAEIEGVHRAMLPELTRLGASQGIVPPANFDPSIIPRLHEIVANAQGVTGGDKAAHVSSRYVNEHGDVIALMSDGSKLMTGEKADPRTAARDQPGIEPGVTIMSGENRGQIIPLTPAGASPPAAAPPAQMAPDVDEQPLGLTGGLMGGQPFYSNVEASIAPLGGIIGSTTGGKHNTGSLHAGGNAVDIPMGASASPEAKANADKMIAELQAKGYRVRDERAHPPGQKVWGGPHLHVEAGANASQSQPAHGGVAAMRPAVSPAQQAAMDRAQEASERGQEAGDRADRAADRAEERAAAADADRKRGSLPAGWRFRPDGTAERIPGTPVAVPAGQKPTTAQKPTAADNLAAGFYDRMASSERELSTVVSEGYKPGGVWDNLTAGQGVMVNWMASPEGQKYRQAQEDWVRAKLRKESGAAIPDTEMDREIKVYFPQPGDKPEVQKQKERSRATAIAAMQRAGSRALAASPSAGPREVTTQAEFDALPSGATYLEDGVPHRKP